MKSTKAYIYLICAFTACMILSINPTHAQQEKGFGFGVQVGTNFADYTNSNGKSRVGLYAGAMIDYNFSRRWGVESGVFFSQQGNRNNAEGGYVVGGQEGRTDHLLDYVSVPLYLKFVVLGGFRVYAGAQASYLISAKRKINYANGSVYETMPSDKVKPFDLAANLGVGYHFKFGLDVAATYSFGFYDVLTYTDKDHKSSMLRVTVGWRFATKRK